LRPFLRLLVKIRSQKRGKRKEERESRGQGIKGEKFLDSGLRRNDGC
jgi:hypothetical protein